MHLMRTISVALFIMVISNLQIPCLLAPYERKRFINENFDFNQGGHHSLGKLGCNNGMDGAGHGTGHDKTKVTNIAQKAAQEAKAASDAQQVAGAQAAHQVKSQLAEKAYEAAEAAEAALSGKMAVVEQLEDEITEIENALGEEKESLKNLQEQEQQGVHAAQLANEELKALSVAMNIARKDAVAASGAAERAEQQLGEKTELVQKAEQHLEEVLQECTDAHKDLENTKQAAEKAFAAAQAAKQNAERKRRKLKSNEQLYSSSKEEE